MDDVVACLLFYTVVILYMTSSTPERFRRSWFWGVTLVGRYLFKNGLHFIDLIEWFLEDILLILKTKRHFDVAHPVVVFGAIQLHLRVDAQQREVVIVVRGDGTRNIIRIIHL